MPIYSDEKSRTIGNTAIAFTEKFKLGEIENAFCAITHPALFAGLPNKTMAYKFTKRPGLYRITWSHEQKRYDVYWMNAPKQ